MSVRISIGQAMVAGIYASPFMAALLWGARNGLRGDALAKTAGMVMVTALMLWVPTLLANVVALLGVRWLGAGLADARFHLTVGLVAGVLLVVIVDLVSRGTAQIGGGPLEGRTVLALVAAGMVNAGWIWVVWRFGLKSSVD